MGTGADSRTTSVPRGVTGEPEFGRGPGVPSGSVRQPVPSRVPPWGRQTTTDRMSSTTQIRSRPVRPRSHLGLLFPEGTGGRVMIRMKGSPTPCARGGVKREGHSSVLTDGCGAPGQDGTDGNRHYRVQPTGDRRGLSIQECPI